MNLFILAAIDFVTLLPFAAFGAVALGMWVVAETFFGGNTKTESRLERLKNRRGAEPTVSKKENLKNLLEQANPKLSEALKPRDEKSVGKLQQELAVAGFRGESAVATFSTLKALCAIGGFFIGGGFSLLMIGFSTWSMLYAILLGAIGMYIPVFGLMFLSFKRKQKIFLSLPDALDLMVVCVEAGLGLDQAMRKVSEELGKTHPVIASEFNVCNQQLQMGLPREEVLVGLGERNGVDDLRTLSSVMIQVDKFGTSVGRALRTQSDSMRTRRRQIAEEKAAKTAVKMIFPLVLFIFPGIFVVLVGPAAITMVNEMLPMMNGTQ